jgi:antitoxin ParD1/3/4
MRGGGTREVTRAYNGLMTTLSVAVPDSVASFVNEQAARKGHKDPAKYLRALILKARREAAREELEQKLIEGLGSGPSVLVTAESWAKRKAKLIRRHSGAGNR